uniref:Uncharacterized protein n=1 Tax=Rhizophora mucronata TaxID=61149 RepID=A0A2P2QVI4_RHIMU
MSRGSEVLAGELKEIIFKTRALIFFAQVLLIRITAAA